jgi:hypothetical protein
MKEIKRELFDNFKFILTKYFIKLAPVADYFDKFGPITTYSISSFLNELFSSKEFELSDFQGFFYNLELDSEGNKISLLMMRKSGDEKFFDIELARTCFLFMTESQYCTTVGELRRSDPHITNKILQPNNLLDKNWNLIDNLLMDITNFIFFNNLEDLALKFCSRFCHHNVPVYGVTHTEAGFGIEEAKLFFSEKDLRQELELDSVYKNFPYAFSTFVKYITKI